VEGDVVEVETCYTDRMKWFEGLQSVYKSYNDASG
jgi:hypothetical protein